MNQIKNVMITCVFPGSICTTRSTWCTKSAFLLLSWFFIEKCVLGDDEDWLVLDLNFQIVMFTVFIVRFSNNLLEFNNILLIEIFYSASYFDTARMLFAIRLILLLVIQLCLIVLRLFFIILIIFYITMIILYHSVFFLIIYHLFRNGTNENWLFASIATNISTSNSI